MKSVFQLLLLAAVALPMVVGCGRSGVTAPVADHDDIAAYVAKHPQADAGTEPEGGDQ